MKDKKFCEPECRQLSVHLLIICQKLLKADICKRMLKQAEDCVERAGCNIGTGFKAGGFDGRANSKEAAGLPYDPEYVTAIEAGLKADLFNRSLRATRLRRGSYG